MKDPGRSFDAVVIGEPQRAFYGNQYGLTYPVLQHCGVGLWVPEVGGAIDPDSEAHDLVMSVFAGMSKGERSRIRIRVRSAMAAQAQIEGRFRNRHRSGVAWWTGALRTILPNRRYTGRQVWNRQRKQKSLIDVEDVGLGHQTRLAWNAPELWVVSDEVAHPALVDEEVFEQVQRRLASRWPKTPRETGARMRRPYALRGLVCCSVCGRKMQGTWNHGRAHYRSRFPYEYALANRIEHPAAVYLREDAVVEHLDAWLAMAFDPGRLALALAEIDDEPAVDTAAETARRELAECDRLLARHRAALEAGADPQMVAEWTRDVRRRRESAEAGLRERSDARPRRLGPAEVGAVVERLGGLLEVLRRADADDKCELYRELGVTMTYQHPERVVVIEAAPRLPVDLTIVSEGGLGHDLVAVLPRFGTPG